VLSVMLALFVAGNTHQLTPLPTATPNRTATAHAAATAIAAMTATAVANATATAQAQASATAGVVQTATAGTPTYADPLSNATNPITQQAQWEQNDHCAFRADGYHVTVG